MNDDTEGWIAGPPPRLSREAVQCEYGSGARHIVLCPSCGFRAVDAVRHRPLSPQLKAAYLIGVVRVTCVDENIFGERLKSKCCDADMVTVGEKMEHYVCLNYVCLYCLKACEAK